jgi:hypothetical protein
MLGYAVSAPASGKFEAKGPTQPVKLDRSQLKGAVQVSFDLQPTSMTFDLPWNYCMVAENGLKVSYFAAETYDPRDNRRRSFVRTGHGPPGTICQGVD